jgi:hypothetical protein
MNNTRKRFLNLFKEPGYRTKLLVFFLIGVILILSAVLMKDPFWQDILVQIAITFVTVVFVQMLWGFVGGDPLELRIDSVEPKISQELHQFELQISDVIHRVDQKVDSLMGSFELLADLNDNNLGIDRIWKDRRAWQVDKKDGLSIWHDRVCNSEHTFILSNTLWNNWLHDDEFRRNFFNKLNEGLFARILIYDPDSRIMELRAVDEQDPTMMGVRQMQSEIGSTLSVISKELKQMKPDTSQHLEVRLTNNYVHPAQIIQADERILVAIYLSGKTGGASPTFQFKGKDSVYFQTYMNQCDILWKRARKISFDELQDFVTKFAGSSTAPVEP